MLSAILLFGSTYHAIAEVADTSNIAAEEIRNVGFDDLNANAKSAVLLGFFEKEMNFAETITRADFARTVYKLVSYKSGNSAPIVTEPPFSDVGIYHFAAGEIEYLKNENIFQGLGDGTFRPEDHISIEQAVTVLFRVAGYGGYLSNHLKDVTTLASEKKLFKNINASMNDELTYETAALLFGNFLFVNTVGWDGKQSIENDTDVLHDMLNVDYSDGILEASNGMSLYDKYTGDKIMCIQGKDYQIADDQNYERYIGYDVRCFFDEDDNVIALLPDANNNVLVLDSKDISEYKDNAYSYFDEKNKKKKAKVIQENDLMINGNYSSDVTGMVPEYGTVTLIDNDNNGSYDVVKVESYITGLVNAVDKTEGSFSLRNTDKNGVPYSFDIDDWDKCVICDKEGYEAGFASINKGTIVNVAVAGSERIKIYFSNDKINEKIGNVDWNERKINLGDKTYNIIKNADLGSWNGKPGVTLTVYLDVFGNVAAFDEPKSEGWRYAYLIRCWNDEATEKIILKIVDEDGQIKTVNCSEKIKFDGKTISSAEMMDAFKAAYNNFEPVLIGVDASDENNAKKYDRLSARLMRYYMSSSGEIKKVDTPVMRSMNDDSKNQNIDTDDCLTINAKENFFYSRHTFPSMLRSPYHQGEVPGEVMTNDKTIVFSIPDDIEDMGDEDNYDVYYSLRNSDLENGEYYSGCGYVTDNSKLYADAVVVAEPASKSSTSSEIGMFDKIYEGLDNDDNVVNIVHGMFNDSETSYVISEKNKFNVEKLQKGDVILYSLSKGEMVVQGILYRYTDNSGILTEDPIYLTGDSGRHFFSNGRVLLARPYRIQDDTILLAFPGTEQESELMYGLSRFYTYNDNKFNQIYSDDIKTYEQYGEDADYVVIHQKDGIIYDKYLMRKN